MYNLNMLKTEAYKSQPKRRRDTLFNILRKHQMLTFRKKYSYSLHRYYKYKNIIKDVEVS